MVARAVDLVVVNPWVRTTALGAGGGSASMQVISRKGQNHRASKCSAAPDG